MSDGLFLYWLPGVDRGAVTRERLLSSPLADVMRDGLRNKRSFGEMIVTHGVAVGPCGSSGTLVCCRHQEFEAPHRIGFYADEQTWRKCGEYWLGFVKEHKPGPDSLQRDQLTTGYDYELGDERIWHAPIIRFPTGKANLPQSMGIDENGNYAETVVTSAEWAWVLACDVWDRYMMGDGLTRPEVFDLAVKCLGLNYRIGPHEATALGLIDNVKAALVLRAAIAGPMIEEMMQGDESKKNQVAEF